MRGVAYILWVSMAVTTEHSHNVAFIMPPARAKCGVMTLLVSQSITGPEWGEPTKLDINLKHSHGLPVQAELVRQIGSK